MKTLYVLAKFGATLLIGVSAPFDPLVCVFNGAYAGTNPEPSPQNAESAPAGIRYYIGDRLKLLIYERLDTPGEPGQDPKKRPLLLERAEFTGTYTVQENGAIVLPLLGSIDADSRSSDEITKIVEAEFSKNFGRTARASVLLDEREPIYVVGQSVSSGTIKYTPGMTVLHAAVNAGLDNAKGDVYVKMEIMREHERQQKAREKLRVLLARHEVLRAEMAGETTVKPDDHLTIIVGAKEAQLAIEAESERRKLILESRKPVLESYSAEIAIATQKKAIALAKLQIANDSMKNREDRDQAVQRLKSRGDANGFLSAQIKGDLSDARMRRAEILSEISGAELELARAQKELARATSEAKMALNQEVASIRDDIFEAEASLAGSQRVLNNLGSEWFMHRAADTAPVFELVRRTKQGPLRLKVNAMTELHPGDLVEIIRPTEFSISSRTNIN